MTQRAFPDVPSPSDEPWRGETLQTHFEEIRHTYPIHDAPWRLQQGCHPAIFIGLDAYVELHAELSAMRNEGFAERLTSGIVGGEGPVDIVVMGKRFRQRLRLCASLSDA